MNNKIGMMEFEVDTAISPFLLHTMESINRKDGISIKSQYKASIFSTIYQSPGITRKEIISNLGIRAGTVTSIVQNLVDNGIVLESQHSVSKERGRPEISLRINPEKWYAISIYCVSMNLHSAIVNNLGHEIFASSERLPASSDNDDFTSIITRLINSLLSHIEDSESVLGITISVPGIVHSEKNEWIFSARWPRMRNLKLQDISRSLGIQIQIKRQLDVQLESNLIKNPELRKGNTLLFHWGYGIGGAYSIDGRIVGSSKGIYCQIGHIPVNIASMKPCICGKLGCLESEAALWAIAADIERTHNCKIEDEVSCRDFLDKNSIIDEDYFRNSLTSVAYALSNLQAILVPDRILVYGSFLDNSEIYSSLKKKVEQLGTPFIANAIDIRQINLSQVWDTRGITASLFHDAYNKEFS